MENPADTVEPESPPASTAATPPAQSYNNHSALNGEVDPSLPILRRPMGRVADNTLRSNRTAVQAIVRHLRKVGHFKHPDDPCELGVFVNFFFNGCDHQNIPQDRVLFVHNMLREFILNYRSEDEKQVSPATMRGYIASVQRVFADFGYKMSLLSANSVQENGESIRCLLDKLQADYAAQVRAERPHNMFPQQDIIKLLKCKACSPATAEGYLNRLVLIVGVTLGVRPSAMVNLTVDQFKLLLKGEERILLFTERGMSDSDPFSPTKPDIGIVSRRPTQIEIRDHPVLDGLINVYSVITEYLTIRQSFGSFSSRFFIQVNHAGDEPAKFFKRQHLGRNAFSKIISTMCAKAGVSKVGVMEMMASNGVRGTLASYLLGAGHPNGSGTFSKLPPDSSSTRGLQLSNNLQQNQQQIQPERAGADITSPSCQQTATGKQSSDEREVKRQRVDNGSSSSPPSNAADALAIPNSHETMPSPGIGIVVVSSKTVKLTVPERYEIVVDCDLDGMNIRIKNNNR